MNTETHVVEIDPPHKYRIHYQVVCSFGDLDRAARTRPEAMEVAWGHVSELGIRMRNEESEISQITVEEKKEWDNILDRILVDREGTN